MVQTPFIRSLVVAREKKLGIGTLQILSIISTRSGTTLTDLCKELKVSTSAITHLSDTLEKLGFATRQHSADDRRKIYLNVTEKGRAALKQVESRIPGNP